jgi:hypothetical protein
MMALKSPLARQFYGLSSFIIGVLFLILASP